MSCLTLLINDSDLRLMADEQIIARAPGYVYQNGEVLLTGEEAVRRARLEPLHTNSQFWRQLHAQKLLKSIGSQQSAADFAYQQINALWNEGSPSSQQVAIATPSNLSNEHATLLLGVAEACPFETLALVDTAVAEIAGADLDHAQGAWYHLDIHLHSSLVTSVHLKDGQYRRGDVKELAVGTEQLRAALMRDISSAFVQETRFDPLRSAETEQALFDQVPALLAEAAADGAASVTIQGTDSTHRLSLPAVSIGQSLQKAYSPVSKVLTTALDTGAVLAITDRASPWLTILMAELPNAEQQVVRLEPRQLSDGIAQAVAAAGANRDEAEGVPWVTHLPAHTPVAKKSSASAPAPSHLLIGTTALALNREITLGYQDGTGFTTDGGEALCHIKPDAEGIGMHSIDDRLNLNGEAITDSAIMLRAGDVLSYAAHSVSCIAVTD